jgi:hypothetical protein
MGRCGGFFVEDRGAETIRRRSSELRERKEWEAAKEAER